MTSAFLEVCRLSVEYPARRGFGGRSRRPVRALQEVDLDLHEGQSLGIVGESGCGKSTFARAVLALVPVSAGEIRWRGWPVDRHDRPRLRAMRREVQVVFQDPFGSLDPRMTAGASVAEALVAIEGPTDRDTLATRVAAALVEVGLDPGLAGRYPHELSGGQCQRVAIARATIARPALLICDEAVSALDVSVQAQIVNLLHDLCARHRMALMFISHNLAVVRHLCAEVVVFYLGRVVERASREELFAEPLHPYTRALLAAIPRPDPAAEQPAAGLAANDAAGCPPPVRGCPYATRCPHAIEVCRSEVPELTLAGSGRAVACHRWEALRGLVPAR